MEPLQRKISTEPDSGQSSMGNSAASTPSNTRHHPGNPLETDSRIQSQELQPLTPSNIQMAQTPAPEAQRPPQRLLSVIACASVNKGWKAAVSLLVVLVLVLGGIALAYSQGSSSAADPLPRPDPCPSEEWMYYRKHCYHHNLNEMDWSASQSFCAQHGASLAVLHEAQDLDTIMKICRKDCWIGLHKPKEDFQWVDGTAFNSSLFKIHGQGECAYVKSNVVSTDDCTLPRHFICKMEPYQAGKSHEVTP
ncbi:C-type lectin domain family 2 member L-like [Rhinatrema bivittatum]|uniref:C-type lectin domain family 2 member L-like n=1 Tax=Rhinatrema bivittatum TaxID=194408 RepID=UPI0011275487|nr:C-type lectin domain family 2 member L-like [Rhinatrema bivittatum]XP_029436382.1 C-type lectin domain family 2 member L-like [Rhinatrema bivittatum]XP_029436383.1 C-type lectin domain family 2 member L-like [Rhinatrema bivittatum]